MAISDKEFGQLQSDMRHVMKTIDQHSTVLDRIDNKLDGVVTETRFEKYVDSQKRKYQDLDKRLRAVETNDQLQAASIWTKLGKYAETALISLIVAAFMYYIVAYTKGQK